MTALCAGAAGLDAFIHIADLLAAVGACIAYRRAGGTDLCVQRRPAHHEFGGSAAYLPAIHHQAKVRRLDVRSSRLKTLVHGCLHAGAVTVKAFIDASPHVGTDGRGLHLLFLFENDLSESSARHNSSGSSIIRARRRYASSGTLYANMRKNESLFSLENTMPAGASQKREHEYKQLQRNFKQSGRYKGREEEVAARIVNKQRSQYGETKAEKQKDREGKSPDRNLPIEDYETLTIPQIKAKMHSLSGKDVAKIRGYEVRHKNRKGVLEALDRRMKNP
jgi:hypothetical protein